MITDEDGRAISEYLPYGTYIVKEHETKGYDTLKPFEVKIDQNEKTYFYNIYNCGETTAGRNISSFPRPA